jgi:hypothetical protein
VHVRHNLNTINFTDQNYPLISSDNEVIYLVKHLIYLWLREYFALKFTYLSCIHVVENGKNEHSTTEENEGHQGTVETVEVGIL